MRLLLDHGCHKNFGDIAMLEAATLKLRKLHPEAVIRIVGNPPLSACVRNDARIEPTNCFDTTGEGYDRLHIAGGGNLNDLFMTLLQQKCTLMQSFLNEKKNGDALRATAGSVSLESAGRKTHADPETSRMDRSTG